MKHRKNFFVRSNMSPQAINMNPRMCNCCCCWFSLSFIPYIVYWTVLLWKSRHRYEYVFSLNQEQTRKAEK